MARAKNQTEEQDEQEQADAEAAVETQARRESGQDVTGDAEGAFTMTADEIQEQTVEDAQEVAHLLEETPANAPLYAGYEGPEVDVEALKTNPNDAIKDVNPAKKVDGTELVEDDEAEVHAFGTVPFTDGTISKEQFALLGRGPVPPVEYGFDRAENTNIDPIETDGILDLKDRNRREGDIIDVNLNGDARRVKYPLRTLTARKQAGIS
jgi:hypothetical protein